jgi:DNA invertase Pin-like site-specific DNA recombinase
MKVGYTRVSTVEQSTARQDLGSDVERVFEDKASGKDTNRASLQEMIEFVRDGDEVVVYSIDRLARDLRDLQSIIQQLNDKGVGVHFVSEKLTFSGAASDAFAQLQLHLMGAFAQFERSIIKQRQDEGIAKAKARGVYRGRKKQIDEAQIIKLTAEGNSQTQVAELIGVTRMTVYRALKKQRLLQANES